MVKPTIKSSSESQDLLRVPGHCQPKIRNAILKNCENDLIHIVCDCVYNVVKGKVPGLTQEKVNKLARHKILVEKGGGFLPSLLPLVAPFIVNHGYCEKSLPYTAINVEIHERKATRFLIT